MSPYAYVGGDPMNYIDPYGLWRFGIGVVVGYTSSGGFSIGAGAAFDVGAVNADLSQSYNFRNDSWTTGAGAGVCIGVCAGVDAEYNTKTGYSLSEHLGVGIGVGVRVSTGIEASQYWNKSGDFLGGTYGAYAGVGNNYVGAKTGYEWGYGGMQGRGAYASGDILAASASVSQNGGFNYGFRVEYGLGAEINDGAVTDRLTYYSFNQGRQWFNHYDRNYLAPTFTKEEYDALPKFMKRPYTDGEAAYHDSQKNYKRGVWSSLPGFWETIPEWETVFDKKTGAIETRDAYMATRNYGNNYVSHFALDMVPYYAFGNSANDRTPFARRLFP